MATETAAPLPSQLRIALTRLSRRLHQQALGDITASQLSALTSIAKHQQVSLGELATIEQIAPPSMTRIAARLEERGLVTRQTTPADRRVSRLEVTPAGGAYLAQTRTRHDIYLAGLLHQLSDQDRALLEQAIPLLERLASNKPVR